MPGQPPPSHVALLYSVVLGHGRRVLMDDLKDIARGLGLGAPQTLVASGNLLFEAPAQTPVAMLERQLEEAVATRLGRRIDIIVKAAATFRDVAAANPFRAEAEAAPASVHVRVMREPMTAAMVEALRPWLSPSERIVLADGHLWMHLPEGAGISKVPGRLTPRHMGVGTARNWNTVRRLEAMLTPEGA
ncbi:DUF1697 domain-containing protein [Phreatobacter sp.]|uniref:DUF1697 domain-containing protein n=1 Tax=Phreatobacter sp. TaxID=1966341 RepID=UPI003F701E66